MISIYNITVSLKDIDSFNFFKFIITIQIQILVSKMSDWDGVDLTVVMVKKTKDVVSMDSLKTKSISMIAEKPAYQNRRALVSLIQMIKIMQLIIDALFMVTLRRQLYFLNGTSSKVTKTNFHPSNQVNLPIRCVGNVKVPHYRIL